MMTANGAPVTVEQEVLILRRALAWHGDRQRMATTREDWQQVIDHALLWVQQNPEPDRPPFSSLAALAAAPVGDGVEDRRYALEWRRPDSSNSDWRRNGGGGFDVPGNSHGSRYLFDREEAMREMAKANARWVQGTEHRVVMIEETPVGLATDKGHYVVTEPAALARPRAAEPVQDRASGIDAFLAAILERSPNGETVGVQYYPNGDWSVSDRPRAAVGEREALIAELSPLIEKAAGPNGWDWMFPLRVKPVDGKPTIVSHKGGNVFRGYIGTWQEADLLVALANAAPRIILALQSPPAKVDE